jgi:riboflavin synthase
MFTGIIQAIGTVAKLDKSGGDARIYLRTGTLDLADVELGDSIAVNGVCLTAVALPGDGFYADVSAETLSCTTLGDLSSGSAVNLEKALTLQTRLGGHLVSGHVDGIGILRECRADGHSQRLDIEAPADIRRYIAAKGSICVDGISLTVNSVTDTRFSLNIVPHTLEMTTLKDATPGRRFNLEVDLIARYLERLMWGDQQQKSGGVTEAMLKQAGF